MTGRRWHQHGGWIAFAAGLLLPLAFAPFNLYLLAPVLVAVLFWTWDEASPTAGAWRGYWFGLGAFLTGTYWLYVSLHIFGKAPVALALVLMAALMSVMAAYTALLGYLVCRFCPSTSALRSLLVLPTAWVIIEWLRGWVLSGFPWLSLGYSTTDSFLAGWIPLGGVFAATAAVTFSAGCLHTLLHARTPLRVTAAVLIVAIWLGGALLQQIEWTDPADESLTISIVQGAVPQDKKWLPEELIPTMRLYRHLTEKYWSSDLIVWPEAAIPALRLSVRDYYDSLREEGQLYDTDMILGIVDYNEETDQYFNGVMAMGESEGTYYKRHLVPFGEYFPVPGFVREWLRLRNLPYSDYTRGADNQAPLLVAGQKIAASICYEDVFGNEMRAMLPEATLLANVSNDAWFGGSIAPHQHLQIARVRAIEAGRYMMRATNNGVSAIIAPDGQITSTIPQFETTVLTGEVRPYTGATPYVLIGDRAIVLFCAVLLVLGVVAIRR